MDQGELFAIGAALTLEHMEEPGRRTLSVTFTGLSEGLWVLRPQGGAGRLGDFPPRTRVIARSGEGDGETTLVAQLTIVGATEDGELLARQPLRIDRFAKRRFFRASVDLALQIRDQACRALDLSGCGMRAQCPREAQVSQGDAVDAVLSLGRGPLISIRMHVLRTKEGPGGSRIVGFDFLEIAERDRDRIVAYVLQQERRRMKALRGL